MKKYFVIGSITRLYLLYFFIIIYMSPIERKKIIPKFKKKLQGFLSDESGKITKEDVLKMGMVAM